MRETNPFDFLTGNEEQNTFPPETRVSPYRTRPDEWEEFIYSKEWVDILTYLNEQILTIQQHILTDATNEEYPILKREMTLMKRFTSLPAELTTEYYQQNPEKADGN